MTVTDDDVLNHYGSTPRGFKESLLQQFTTGDHNIFHSDESYDYDGYSHIPEHLSGIQEKEEDGRAERINKEQQGQNKDHSQVNIGDGTTKIQKNSADIPDGIKQRKGGNIEQDTGHLYTEVNIKHRSNRHNKPAESSTGSLYQSVTTTHLEDEDDRRHNKTQAYNDDKSDAYDDGHLYATVIRKNKNNKQSLSQPIHSNTFGGTDDSKSKGSTFYSSQHHDQKEDVEGDEDEDDGFVIDLDQLLREEEEKNNDNESSNIIVPSYSSTNNGRSGRSSSNDPLEQSNRQRHSESYYGDVSSTNYGYTTKESDTESKISRLGTTQGEVNDNHVPSWKQRRSPVASYRSRTNESSENSSHVKSSIAVWKDRESLGSKQEQESPPSKFSSLALWKDRESLGSKQEQESPPLKFSSRFKKRDKNKTPSASKAKFGSSNNNNKSHHEVTPRVSVKDMWKQRVEQDESESNFSEPSSSVRPALSSSLYDHHHNHQSTSVDEENVGDDRNKSVNMSEESIEAMFDLGDDETNIDDRDDSTGGVEDYVEESFADILRKQMMF